MATSLIILIVLSALLVVSSAHYFKVYITLKNYSKLNYQEVTSDWLIINDPKADFDLRYTIKEGRKLAFKWELRPAHGQNRLRRIEMWGNFQISGSNPGDTYEYMMDPLIFNDERRVSQYYEYGNMGIDFLMDGSRGFYDSQNDVVNVRNSIDYINEELDAGEFIGNYQLDINIT